MMESAMRRHIEEIRTHKFSIGKQESNPLTQDLHHAVSSLSAELYTKDVHFLMELIQNAEDNEYEECVEPTLEFLLTKEDITGSGSPATLLIFNNEVGFSKRNMDSICSVGCSTKKGKRQQGFVGEKGIGFKSVFLVSCRPHIFSNGYQVRFREEPDPHCGIGYIVPEWVDERPRLSDLRRLYRGSNEMLPNTILVLPLKPEKVEAVRGRLSELHPEILLFLTKVKRLYVRGDGFDSREKDNVSIVSISSETNRVDLRSQEADSHVVRLSVEDKSLEGEETCKYFMWRQVFPVKPSNRVSSRADVDRWTITLAFPFEKRLRSGTSFVGVFAFLPTAMVTNFPFVIQADFLLTSSRESILLDNSWNLGIMECVPEAFTNAFFACLRAKSLFSSISQVFGFLPSGYSSYEVLNNLRETIRKKMQCLKIVPYKMFDRKIHFERPRKVVNVSPVFRDILSQIVRTGGSLIGLRTVKKISYLNHENDRTALDYMGVKSAKKIPGWYANCISSCNLVTQASATVYVDLLCFVMKELLTVSGTHDIPLLQYTSKEGTVKLCSISQIAKGEVSVRFTSELKLHCWLSRCNEKLGCLSKIFFLPNDVVKSLLKHSKTHLICSWLERTARVAKSSVSDYFNEIFQCVSQQPDLTVLLLYFLYHARKKGFINDGMSYELCAKVPVIDGSGSVRDRRSATLVSVHGSNWVKLFGPNNPYSEQSYVDISDVYAKGGQFLGESTPDKVVLKFIYKYGKATDLPELTPPNVELQVAYSQLSMEQAFQLLDWIRFLRTKGSAIPEKFRRSIQNGKWMKTFSGFNSPKQCILPVETSVAIYDMVKHVVGDIFAIDQEFYGNRISLYQDELRFIGVAFGSDDVHKLVTARFLSIDDGTSGITKEWAFSLLEFIRFSKKRNAIDEQWILEMKKKKWLQTCKGYDSPENCVLLQSLVDPKSYTKLTDLPIVDENYYGCKLRSFLSEFKLLGVAIELSEFYKLLVEKASFSTNCPTGHIKRDFLILKCIKHLGPIEAGGLIERIKDQPWLKTTCGFKRASEVTRPNSTLSSLVKALNVAAIDELYYQNKMEAFVNELRAVGVAVDTASIINAISAKFKSLVLSSGLTSGIVLSMLGCFRELSKTMPIGCEELKWLSTEKWLKTRHGFKAPNESILSGMKLGMISFFIDLPLLDDGYYGIDLYKYKAELQMLGVITDFEEGAEHVLKGLNSPICSEFVTSYATMALLESMKSTMSKSPDQPLPENFKKNIAQSRCLKTTHDHVVPEECILFDSSWETMLRRTDLPCIEVTYYSPDITAFKEQLRAIGVRVDSIQVCSLISRFLFSQTETSLIKRLYRFLRWSKWKPEKLDNQNSRVWIPSLADGRVGEWVNSDRCVIHYSADLFSSRLVYLCNYYEPELLPLFSSAFGVREFPMVGDYLQLWNDWSSRTDYRVSSVDCHSFWECLSRFWNSGIEETLKQSLTKVCATSCLSKRIHLVNKEKVFIPDDLRLKKIFSSVSVPLFAWFPTLKSSTSYTLTQSLKEIYSVLGVKKLSASVKCTLRSDLKSLCQQTNLLSRNGLIEKGLIKIILCFLAGPGFYMSAKERREIVASLIKLTLFQSDKAITCTYSLSQSPKVEVETKKMVFWDKNNARLLIDKSGYEGRKTNVEFGSCFVQEIVEGLLPVGSNCAVDNLSKTIHLGLMYEFNEVAVDHLLVQENLELIMEDNEFLEKAFSGSEHSCVVLGKRPSKSMELAPSTPSKKPCKSEL